MTPERAWVAREIDRQVLLRGAREVVEIPGGWVIRDQKLAQVYDHNTVWLAAPLSPELDAEAVVALTNRWLGDAGHRQLRFDDHGPAEPLAADLCARGWERRRTVLMAMSDERHWPPLDPRAVEVSEAEMRVLQLADYRESEFGDDATEDLPQLLVEAQAALRAGTEARRFGAGEDGGLQSMCTLFLDPDLGGRRVALVESVATLQAHRERGLASAVIGAALRAADEWRADEIVIPADADDWPQVFYARLGFEPVGLQLVLTRRGSG